MRQILHKNSGITLVEMLIVLAIIGIIAAVGIPTYVGQQTRADRSEAESNLTALRLLEEQFLAENGDYAPIGGGMISYKATLAADSGIEDVLQGFRPGGQPGLACLGLKFAYRINQNFQITAAPVLQAPTVAAAAPCFTAVAIGCPGTRVANEVFAIDCNNTRNF